jgi:hypothetical protein
MHKKYGSGVFAALSVSLDDPNEPGVRDKVLKFLESKDATFTNLILDEKPEVWQEKLKFEGPPCVYVFNAEGAIARQFKDEFTYADVDKVVQPLLARK